VWMNPTIVPSHCFWYPLLLAQHQREDWIDYICKDDRRIHSH
jgi:hypothetical protein